MVEKLNESIWGRYFHFLHAHFNRWTRFTSSHSYLLSSLSCLSPDRRSRWKDPVFLWWPSYFFRILPINKEEQVWASLSQFWWFFLATCSLLVGTISLLPWISRISRWRMSTFVFSVPSSNSPKWRNPCLPPKRLLMMTCMPSILHSWQNRNVNLIHHELASFTPSTSNTLFLNTDSLRMI